MRWILGAHSDDPIETWSLVVWLIHAVYLHLKYMRRWRGERLGATTP